ncbi:11528_t:CDS:2 [Ambispora gerdemannii]|uniref:11528_t:CDS:1 n=1 Tax=Ambispora gerdemannii TaxID=144530 RepID=A0A9N8ZHC8_9GLOM|nr:11528_t:CDS:2 [Ambispora gerdemannii]
MDLLIASTGGSSEYDMRETPVRQLASPDPFSLSTSHSFSKRIRRAPFKAENYGNKRQEDREKMHEAELLRQEVAQFTSIKPKLQG